MKQLVKRALNTLAPAAYQALAAKNAKQHNTRVVQEQGLPALTQTISDHLGSRVLSGPFEGMEYILRAVDSSYAPKLIGSYECELHDALKETISSGYQTIIDIGSAEGYYVVGLALRLPQARVHAFDIDADARRFTQELVAKNNVSDRVQIKSRCGFDELRSLVSENTLIVCDCEGCEQELLDPDKAPSLHQADILVEMHEDVSPGIMDLLRQRFSPSHRIQIFDTVRRDRSDYPFLHFLPSDQQELALCEFRHGPQRWAFLRSKQNLGAQ